MGFRLCLHAVILSLLTAGSLAAAGKPEDDLAAAIRIYFGKSFNTDWSGLDALPGIQWAPLPPTSLPNCLPDGGCFTRQGKAMIGGRNLVVIATGARTIVNNLYLRNATAPFGEAAVLAALKSLNITADLARCPVQDSVGSTKWYRLRSGSTNPGILSIQSNCGGRPCEGFVLTQSQELPPLQPAQLKLYSEQCSVPAAERKAVATGLPHEAFAQVIAALIPSAAGPALSDWKALSALPAPIQWLAAVPQKMDLSFKNDPNPYGLSGEAAIPGRKFSVLASGTASQPMALYFDEMGMHPRGEHVLGVLYSQGLTVKLVRCGPVYTESTNNWYNVTSAKTQPVMLRQSIRYDGNQVQDTYELRLDNTLPKRDPRDRDPGVGGCK